jgi:hypothetical protein
LSHPRNIAVDWISKKLYIVETDSRRIDVSTYDGLLRTVVIGDNMTLPIDVALDPIRGMMFFTDEQRVESAAMDGSDRRIIVTGHLNMLTGLSVDIPSRRVYFCDGKVDRIESVAYDGTDRQTVSTTVDSHTNMVLSDHLGQIPRPSTVRRGHIQ